MRLGTFSNGGLGFGLTFTLIDDFTTAARSIERQMISLQGAASAMATSVETSMSRIKFGAAGLLLSLIGLAGWVKAAKIDAQFQSYEISFKTFLGSAQEAHRVFEQIKKDAIINPRFSIDAMEKANTMLISQGIQADKSMRVVRNLSTVIAGVGGGNPELNRVAAAMEKIEAAGTMSSRHLLSFIHARVPILKILSEYLNKRVTSENLKSLGITVDILDKALEKATSSAGKFGTVLDNLKGSISANWAVLADQMQVTWGAIGEAIRPATVAFLKLVTLLFQKLYAFAQTDVGRVFIRIAFTINVVLFAFSLLLIIVGLSRLAILRMASAFGAANKVLILNTIATQGVAAGFRVMFVTAMRSLVGFARSLVPFALYIAQFWVLYKAINSNIPALHLLALTLMIVMGPIGWIAGGIFMLLRAVKDFNAVLDGTVKPATGILGVFQRLGAIMRWVWAAFSGFNSETNEIVVSKRLLAAMDYLGMGNFARNSATWIGRIRTFFRGFGEGVSAAIDTVKDFVVRILNLFNPLGTNFKSWDDMVSKNGSSLQTWKDIGIKVGKALVYVLGTVLIILGLIAVAMLVNAAISIITFVAMTWEIWLVVAAIFALLWIINKLTGAFDEELTPALNNLKNIDTGNIGATLGANLVKGIKDGITGNFGTVTDALKKNMQDAKNTGNGWEQLPLHGNMNSTGFLFDKNAKGDWGFSYDRWNNKKFRNPKTGEITWAKSADDLPTAIDPTVQRGAPSWGNPWFSPMRAPAAGQQQGAKNITVNFNVDGRKMAQIVMDTASMNAAKAYDYSTWQDTAAYNASINAVDPNR